MPPLATTLPNQPTHARIKNCIYWVELAVAYPGGAAAPLLTPGYATAHRVTHYYPYCIVFSSILLQHILDNSQSIGRQLEVKSLMETVHAFNVTNKEMSPTRNKPAGYSQCVQCCKVCADFFVREES